MSTTSPANLVAGTIMVQAQDITSDALPYRDTPVTYELRWVNNSPRSYHADSTIYDYFEVTISYECATDILTVGTNIGVWAYTLGSTEPPRNF